MALNRLPQEILILISDSLDQIDHKSVRSLAVVNRAFLSICLPLLKVRALKFVEYNDDGERLADDIWHYSEILQHFSGFWAVRRLIIVTIDNDPGKLRQHRQRQSQQPWCRPIIDPNIYAGCENDYLKVSASKPGNMKYRGTVHQKNHIWQPLAEFILRLPNLECVYYNSYYQFPPCLLDSLQRSQCRLYINRFALWSLGPQGPTDPYELTLMRSPSLHGIGMAGEGIYGNRMVESTTSWEHIYLTEALRYVVSGAPQLKMLIVTHLRGYRRTPTRYFSPPPWAGFTLQGGGFLEHLEIRETDDRNRRQNTMEDMEKWNQDTDFSVLRTLKICDCSTLDALEYMATNCQFHSLTKLTLYLKPKWHRGHPSDYYSAASSFLLRLPPLSSLKLHTWHPKMATESILRHHGPRLQRLWILPSRGETVPLETLQHLSENCPVLEELSIRVSRSRGDFHEVSKYKAIGALPRLTRLFLKLDASDMFLLDGFDYEDLVEGREPPETRNDASFSSFDQRYSECTFFHDYLRPRNGHVRDAFINAALDEDLARSIFQTIRSGNNTNGIDLHPLEVLELRVRGAGQLSWDGEAHWGFHDVLRRLSRGHRVTRKRDGDFEIKLEDIHEDMTSTGRSISFGSHMNRMMIPNILPIALQIYHRVWPPKNADWRDDWHSFPLALSAEDEIDWSKE